MLLVVEHRPLDLSFVRDESLRLILERDWEEIGKCTEAGSHKAVLVLAGSVIEAILVDYMLANPPSSANAPTVAQILKMELGPLIQLAQQEQIVNADTRDIANVLREFRNLIHPGRELRLKAKIGPDRADIAKGLVCLVAEDLRAAYAKIPGHTADEVIEQIVRDPAKVHVAEYLVEKTHPQEREKLFRLLPQQVDVERTRMPQVLAALLAVHRALKSALPPVVLQTEAAKVVAALNEGHAALVRSLLFFRDDLQLLDDKDRTAILVYLLRNIANTSLTSAAFHAGLDLKFVGRYMTPELSDLFKEIIAELRHHHDDRFTFQAIEQVADYMEPSVIRPIYEALKAQGAYRRVLEAIDQVP